ncbi:T9SS type A sorting domain-containing protein [Segetibacter koreensis]|uniref:T9SS type A sorting domain-containing protein n=1 Tax=Segetibacter koreensis TaxID=398037 RepID=UPI000372B457|nr:T9SS type A sorting domain-containing protein [Segetibacter koreensis]
MYHKKLSILVYSILFLTTSTLVLSQQINKSFSFILNNSAKTSAGIYKTDGTLIRTLWSGVNYNAGTYKINWDGTDDNRNNVPVGNYIAKVLSNNVSYKWEGVIGNTSDSMTGSTVYHSNDIIKCMAISGNTAFCGAGYAEGHSSQIKFSLATPQQKKEVFGEHSTNQSTYYNTTDGVNVYWAGYDPFKPSNHFVFATKINGGVEALFSSGSTLKMTYGITYKSVIDYLNNDNATITGLAVQKNHDYLFVSHKVLNQIHVLNKSTGALAQIISFTSPRGLAIDGNDNLWVISGANTVSKYTVNSKGYLSSAIVRISGLINPLAIAVSPDNKTVVVADAGTSQQLKAFNNSNGSSLWTYGQLGGYKNDATVLNNRFYFSDLNTVINSTFICFEPNGSFWVGDTGNFRMQHYSADRTFINRIMYLPTIYSVYADPNKPSRVIAGYLEFAVDYSKPVGANNGSWKLVKNWMAAIPPKYFGSFTRILQSVTTLSNGRTYALRRDETTNTPVVVELPATGQIRFTGIKFDQNSDKQIYSDGSLRSYLVTAAGISWYKQTLTGFDNSNNPVWGPPISLASTSDRSLIPGSAYPLPIPITSSNIVIAFNGGGDSGYALGGIKTGSAKWKWKTAMTTHKEYEGAFPPDGYFDKGNGVQYAGNVALAFDRNIVWGYNGEFWKQSQTNKWNHVYDNGLFVGQFGVTGPEVKGQEAAAMMAGNAFSPAMVKVGNNYYLYHNDESHHGGVHRWKISGIETIQEQSCLLSDSFLTSITPLLPGIDLMAGLPFNKILEDNTAGWTRNPTENNIKTWIARTNIKTYDKRKSPDLWVAWSNNISHSIRRDLGSNTNLSSWDLSGKISYEGNMPNTDNAMLYFDVLDNFDKILVRFYTKINFNNWTVSIYANNILVSSGDSDKMENILAEFQPLDIKLTNGAIKVTYAKYPAVIIKSFDAAANIHNPKTMRLSFKYVPSGNIFGKKIDLDEMRFVATKSTSSIQSLNADTSTSIATTSKSNVIKTGTKPEVAQSFSNIDSKRVGMNLKKRNNYYEIKTGDQTGINRYSKILKLKLKEEKGNFNVYPNPVTDNYLTVKFNNISKGIYLIKLISSNGQTIYTKTLTHLGGSASQSIPFNPNFSSGTYNLQITGDGSYFNKRLLK